MTRISTHVLDTTTGTPAAGVAVVLRAPGGAAVASAATDADGRVAPLVDTALEPGAYALAFATGEWFARRGAAAFHPEVVVAFTVSGEDHLHVPLLLAPYAYSTYRGS